PEEYLPALSPSDYFDAGKRQQKLAIFKVPAGKSFEAPPILLQRRSTLRGVVVDDQGKPLPGAGVSGIAMTLDRRTGVPKAQAVSAFVGLSGNFLRFRACRKRRKFPLKPTNAANSPSPVSIRASRCGCA